MRSSRESQQFCTNAGKLKQFVAPTGQLECLLGVLGCYLGTEVSDQRQPGSGKSGVVGKHDRSFDIVGPWKQKKQKGES